MSENFYWLILIFVFAAYVFFNSRNAERRDLEHLNSRAKRKIHDTNEIKTEDKYLINLYLIDKNKAIKWYRERHCTSLRFTQKVVEQIICENHTS